MPARARARNETEIADIMISRENESGYQTSERRTEAAVKTTAKGESEGKGPREGGGEGRRQESWDLEVLYGDRGVTYIRRGRSLVMLPHRDGCHPSGDGTSSPFKRAP